MMIFVKGEYIPRFRWFVNSHWRPGNTCEIVRYSFSGTQRSWN